MKDLSISFVNEFYGILQYIRVEHYTGTTEYLIILIFSEFQGIDTKTSELVLTGC